MANLNDVCKEIVENTEHALAAGVIDLESGLLLGVAHGVNYFNQEVLDTVAAASVEMFRGRSTQTVESMLADLRGQEPGHSIVDLHFSTAGTHHFMTVVPGKPDALAILVTRDKVRLGFGWSSLQNRLKQLAEVCP
jgi:hypothetical protein